MHAVFGRLQGQALELGDGLNIIQSPNEAGKSTWCAFLLSMLYGVNSRERERNGYVPDKVRYAPWSGAPMSGRMDCRADSRELTLLRSTRRSASPMGEFRAVYAGTSEPVAGLSGQVCGEALLGVTREVYERSAFIRQAGLPLSQEASLERRIEALVSSGQEDVSCSEAAAVLKKQLNQRRHNRTGQLPALEEALEETERRLSRLRELEAQLSAAQEQADTLAAREAELVRQLARRDRWEAHRRLRALEEARDGAESARQRALDLRQDLEDHRVPEMEAIARLRGGIANLEMTRRSLLQAQEARDRALETRQNAEHAAGAHPFAGMTPAQAEALPLDLPPRPRVPVWGVLLALIIGLGLFAAVYLARRALLPAMGCGLGAGGLCLLFLGLLASKKQKRWEALTAERRQERSREVETYAVLFRALQESQADAAAKSAACDGLSGTIDSVREAILAEVRRFNPAVADLDFADQALRAAVRQRKELAAAEEQARDAQSHWEFLFRQAQLEGAPPLSEEDAPSDASPASPPDRSREDLSAELEDVREHLTAARSQADLLLGQFRALGDPAVLQSDAAHTREEIARLEREYQALQLALETLEEASVSLQSRFSPALGRRTGEIFQELTGGRYRGAALDRSLHLSAEPAGDVVSRDLALLSVGAADQLYLAARLAICQTVLPAEDPAPLVLDDALVNFDDERCGAALRWLRREAETRQILLFTCHSREAEFFARDPEVRILRLTDGS